MPETPFEYYAWAATFEEMQRSGETFPVDATVPLWLSPVNSVLALARVAPDRESYPLLASNYVASAVYPFPQYDLQEGDFVVDGARLIADRPNFQLNSDPPVVFKVRNVRRTRLFHPKYSVPDSVDLHFGPPPAGTFWPFVDPQHTLCLIPVELTLRGEFPPPERDIDIAEDYAPW